ncbi:MAG TPA: BBP7 family outer membrane beta-barrel protein [Gemmataceae bacterium]|jgi:hypothetical protein|nr:BBP7 family outer membrane beta-barrel protein [Gemmataceae bacterium]
MAKWSIGVAVVVVSLAAASGARAQFGPDGSGAPPMSEPVPIAPSSLGYPAPAAPPGGPACEPLTPPLPDDTINAFSAEVPACGPSGCYAGVGALALQRVRRDRRTLAVLDPQNLDTGIPPPANAPVAATFGGGQTFAPGVVATVGYHWQTCALEFSGFYIPSNTSTNETDNPGRLDSFFFNPPLGFEGDNGLWLQADQIRTSLRTALGNAELNAILQSISCEDLQFIVGARYIDLQERLQIFTDDDGLTIRTVTGQPDPLRQATYQVSTQDRLIAGQFGLAYNTCICPWLSLDVSGKAGVGANFADVALVLTRGDGLVGRTGQRENTMVSQVYDTGIFLDWHCWEGMHLRTGYTAMWLVHVPEATNQVDFNLEHNFGTHSNDNGIFFHGPLIEFECFF